MSNSNSPLDFFRRHKGLVMGTMLLSMVLFVVGGSLDDIGSTLGFSRSTPAKKAVFTWSGGTVNEQEMWQMRQARHVCIDFLKGIMSKTIEQKGTPRAIPLIGMYPGQEAMIDDEDTVVETLLLAEKAKKLGVVVTDETVKNYLNDLTNLTLTTEEINDMVVRATNRRMSQRALWDQIKHELRAQQVRIILQPDSAISLSEAWDYHNRLYRRVKVEALPINVSDYVSKVTVEPSENDKRELYDKYKFNSPDPQSPDPGFFRPAKLSFDYVKVDFAPYLKEAEKEITEEEIKKEYDTGVEHGDFKTPVKEEKPEGEKPAEGDKPEAEKPEGEKPAETPEGKKPDEGKPDAKPEETPAEESTEPKACLQDDSKKDEPAKSAAKDEPAKPADPAAKPADPVDPAKPVDPADPAKPADPATETPPAAKPPEPKKPEMRVKTLDEVRDEIRTRLARPKAQDAQKKVVDAMVKELEDYAKKHLIYTEAKQAKGNPEKPEKLDVEVLGRKYKFAAGSTPLVNRYEVSNFELGKDAVFYRDINSMQNIRSFDDFIIPFARQVYANRAPDFEPQQAASSSSPGDVTYIFWVTGSQPAEQPKYEDAEVQKELIAAWKISKAVELAKAAAQEIAKKAEGKESLKDVVSDEEAKKLITPPLFSWFNMGSLPFGSQMPELSKVEQIELAGEEFLEPVCTAQVGETVVANDHPRTKVYAVKVLSQELSDDVLRSQFYASGITPQLQMLSRIRAQQNYYARMEEITKEFALHWNRAPNSGGGNGSGEDS